MVKQYGYASTQLSVQCDTRAMVHVAMYPRVHDHDSISPKRKLVIRTDKEQAMVDLQFLEIAVRNVVGTPIRHRIELDAMRELHLGSGLEVTAGLRTACVLRPASKGLSPEPELSEAGGPRALLRRSCLLPLSLLSRSNTR